jgi:hypothetical protein
MFTTSQPAAGRTCNIDIKIYGSKGSIVWNHERPAELRIGRRDEANQIFFESPILQTEETRSGRPSPVRPPHGLHGCHLESLRRLLYGSQGKEGWAGHPR